MFPNFPVATNLPFLTGSRSSKFLRSAYPHSGCHCAPLPSRTLMVKFLTTCFLFLLLNYNINYFPLPVRRLTGSFAVLITPTALYVYLLAFSPRHKLPYACKLHRLYGLACSSLLLLTASSLED